MFTILALALAASAPTAPAAQAPDCTNDGEPQVCFVHEDPAGVSRIARPDGTDLIVVLPNVYAFGAEHGDTIVVRFPGSDGLEEADFQDRCDDFGGQLLWTTMFTGGHRSSGSGEFVCEDVDF